MIIFRVVELENKIKESEIANKKLSDEVNSIKSVTKKQTEVLVKSEMSEDQKDSVYYYSAHAIGRKVSYIKSHS